MVRIGEETFTENVVLFRDAVRISPVSLEVSTIADAELLELIAGEPEIIIYGAGWQPVLPPRDLVFALARRGIGFEIMDTPAACRTFNILVGEDRDVAAVLVLD